MSKWRPKKEPHHPPDWDQDVVLAVRAFYAGKANEGQQKMVWAWLMYAGEHNQVTYRPDDVGGARASAFADGKQFLPIMLNKMLTDEVWAALEKMVEAEAAADRRARKEESRS